VWAEEWRRTDLSFAGLTPHLNAAILAAAPESGRAVDIGCGAGGTSIALAAARPGLSILGIDLSESSVEAARGRAAAHPNLAFRVGDATDLGGLAVDLFCSRHGVMFFDDPIAAFARLRAAVTAEGAFVFSCFRDYALNSWAIDTVTAVTGTVPATPGTAPGPFAFADADRVRAILQASGWQGEARPIDYTLRAGEGPDAVDQALAFFSRIGPTAARLREMDDEDRDAGRQRLRGLFADRLQNGAVDFPAAAWIWSCRPA
jgi:SAM-dependent methyltransferase